MTPEENKKYIYLDESKDLQYFSYMRHNGVPLDAFVKFMKMMNHTGLCDNGFA